MTSPICGTSFVTARTKDAYVGQSFLVFRFRSSLFTKQSINGTLLSLYQSIRLTVTDDQGVRDQDDGMVLSKEVCGNLVDCSFKAGKASLYIYLVFACLSRTVHDACLNTRDLISTSLSPSELIPSAEGLTQVFLLVVPASRHPFLTLPLKQNPDN